MPILRLHGGKMVCRYRVMWKEDEKPIVHERILPACFPNRENLRWMEQKGSIHANTWTSWRENGMQTQSHIERRWERKCP